MNLLQPHFLSNSSGWEGGEGADNVNVTQKCLIIPLAPQPEPPRLFARVSRIFRCLLPLATTLSFLGGYGPSDVAAVDLDAGPLADEFSLTLAPGHRLEILGPLFYREESEGLTRWGLPPFLSVARDPLTDLAEFDLAYPILTYDRFGAEYRWQLFQLLSFSGGTSTNSDVHRFTLFPFYFQQRSEDPRQEYTAFLPFYGHLRNRLFRDEIEFVMLPIYVKTQKRDLTTYNYLFPIFHRRYGPNLFGWQVWPLLGHEERAVATITNAWGDPELVPGHDKWFALWPIYFNQTTGLGSTNAEHQFAVLPLFSAMRSPMRDSTTAPWPLGITYTVDRAKQYREWGFPWPIMVIARGEGKHTTRVWPFFSQARNPTLRSDFYLWPVYKYNRLQADPLDRERTRILFFLYSDITEVNRETGGTAKRRDFWPVYHYRYDWEGNERLQALALLESVLPNNKSIERNYSPLWSLWRAEHSAKSGASSQSLVWNLYRHEDAVQNRKSSLLFGLVQWEVTPEGRTARWFYLPRRVKY